VSTVAAYFFFDIREVVDRAAMEEYRRGVFASVERHGGIYRVLGGHVEPFEGAWQPVQPVIIEFPSADQARRWYHSEDYRALLALRRRATRGDAVLLEGWPPA
jgi:uncharacterized protein (DUF1330 family)